MAESGEKKKEKNVTMTTIRHNTPLSRHHYDIPEPKDPAVGDGEILVIAISESEVMLNSIGNRPLPHTY